MGHYSALRVLELKTKRVRIWLLLYHVCEYDEDFEGICVAFNAANFDEHDNSLLVRIFG
jgi:hypothetical protein